MRNTKHSIFSRKRNLLLTGDVGLYAGLVGPGDNKMIDVRAFSLKYEYKYDKLLTVRLLLVESSVRASLDACEGAMHTWTNVTTLTGEVGE